MIGQTCEMAGLIYQYYCAEGKNLAEIVEDMEMTEETLRSVAKYYDMKKEVNWDSFRKCSLGKSLKK